MKSRDRWEPVAGGKCTDSLRREKCQLETSARPWRHDALLSPHQLSDNYPIPLATLLPPLALTKAGSEIKIARWKIRGRKSKARKEKRKVGSSSIP